MSVTFPTPPLLIFSLSFTLLVINDMKTIIIGKSLYFSFKAFQCLLWYLLSNKYIIYPANPSSPLVSLISCVAVVYMFWEGLPCKKLCI